MYNIIQSKKVSHLYKNETNGKLCNALQHAGTPQCNIMDITNDYILVFNRNLALTSISRACNKTLKDGISMDSLMGNDLFFFAPDLENIGSHTYFENSLPGDIYKSQEYTLKASVNKDSIYSDMIVTKFKNEIIIVAKDITREKFNRNIAKQQKSKTTELTQKIKNLRIAIDVLTDNMNRKRKAVEKNCQCNLEELILPMLDILKSTKLEERQANTIDTLESTLKIITDSLSHILSTGNEFTQREIQIANLIRLGKTTKQISDMLYLSCKTVDFHRMNIRKKLGISNTKDNLRSYLLAIGSSQVKDSI